MYNVEKIGILGGTFNPIHFGHLLLAESARDRLKLDKVLFIPTGNNPFKVDNNDIDAEHRYNMIKLVKKKNPAFEVSRVEIERVGYTYTIDTINQLEKNYLVNNDYYFITGADLMFEITKWKRADQLLKKVKFITTFRPGYDNEKLDNQINMLNEVYNADIYKLYTPEMNISSSEIRSRIKNGYSIKYLLPDDVEEYIYRNDLYL